MRYLYNKNFQCKEPHVFAAIKAYNHMEVLYILKEFSLNAKRQTLLKLITMISKKGLCLLSG